MTGEQQREYDALRWLVTRMAAELILKHPNPTQKMAELRAENDQLATQALGIEGANAVAFFQVMTNVSLLLDDVEDNVKYLLGQ